VTHDEMEALARRLAALVDADASGSLLTAAQVAARLGVARTWVYAHANELGVVRLGDGPRPRLRFDPAIVARLADPAAPRTPRRELLPIKTPRPRRRRRRVGDELRRAQP
jgi:hypothetical protein